MVAKVAVARAVYAIDKPYDYLVPGELEPRLRPGMRVLVPFGSGNRGSDGLVLALREGPDGAEGLKSITAALDPEPVLDGPAIRLALWMRERYFCTVYDAVKAMLPAGLYFSLRDWIVLKKGADRAAVYEAAEGSAPARQLAELLLALGGRGDMEQIRAAFGPKDPEPAIRRLLERGAAARVTSAQRGVGDKVEKLAVLAMPAEEAMALVAPRRRTAPLRFSVTELLCQLGSASAKELCYFTGASMQTLRSLEKSGVLTLERQEVFRRVPLDEVEPAGPIRLNEEQERAFQGLEAMSRAGAGAALLYGVTGSGKTQVYLRLIQETLARGRTALVLVPEIALTPQLLRIFAAHFGGQIGVLHSSLRAGERYDEWKRIRRGEARVVIGTRSAVFAPLEQLGLVILDEEQEASYKSENNPRYHARDVAKYRCVQSGALLVMGSATPSVETMYSAQTGRCGLFTLKERFNRRALPQVQVVDMKEELRAGNGRAISRPLQQALEDTLVRGEQAILFLNRRGEAPFLVGTQMVAKGLDFENVTLVGVVLADQSLFVDDFRAGERTFSLLTQVVGRAGRGEKAGRALIQTFTPEHDVLRFSARQDYDSFYRTEIQLRRLRREPPFRDVFLITASGLNEGAVLRASVQFRQALEGALGQLDQEWQLLGPAPAAVAKINDRYRYRLTLTAQNSRALRQLLAALLRAAHQDRENRGVSLYADLNPY